MLLQNIRVPVFAVATERDHVAPSESVHKIYQFSDCDVTFALTSGGHNVGIVTPPDHPRRVYRLATRKRGAPLLSERTGWKPTNRLPGHGGCHGRNSLPGFLRNPRRRPRPEQRLQTPPAPMFTRSEAAMTKLLTNRVFDQLRIGDRADLTRTVQPDDIGTDLPVVSPTDCAGPLNFPGADVIFYARKATQVASCSVRTNALLRYVLTRQITSKMADFSDDTRSTLDQYGYSRFASKPLPGSGASAASHSP